MKLAKLNKISLFLLISVTFTSCTKLQDSVRGYMKQEKYSLIKGINAQDQGKTEDALKNFQDAHDRNPNNAFTMKQLAYIYSEIGEEVKAEEFYLKVLEKEPNDGITLHNLGTLYYKQQKYNKSLDYLNQVPKKSLNNEIIKLKVYDYYLLEDYLSAYKTSQEIVEDETDIEFLVIYAKILFNTRKLGELHSFVTRLYKKYPEVYAVIDVYTDHLWNNLGETQKVVQIYKNYIVKNGAEKEAVLKISGLFYQQEDYFEAKKYIGLILEEDMFDIEVLELKVKIYRKIGMEKEAQRIEQMLAYEKE